LQRPTAANPTIIVGTGKNSSLKSCEKRKTLDFKQKAVGRMGAAKSSRPSNVILTPFCANTHKNRKKP